MNFRTKLYLFFTAVAVLICTYIDVKNMNNGSHYRGELATNSRQGQSTY